MSILSNAVSSAASQVNSAASSAASQIGTTASNALSSLTGTNSSTTSTGTTRSTAPTGSQTIAGNFDTFLQLLTTQLQNQDPLSPLDTTQFTQQLVEFASVEQQVNMNTNLQTLISMQQTSEATSALQLVGNTVTVNGNAAALSNATNSPATWSINSSAPATGTVTITSSAGTTAYTGTVALNCRNAELYLERRRQQRPDLARRHLHDGDQRDRRQRPARHRVHSGAGRRHRRQH